ncbi:MAG: ATP-binding protein [Chloroflexota bacterium]
MMRTTRQPGGYWIALAAVAVAVAVLLPFRNGLDVLAVLLWFLAPCVGVALAAGAGPALLTAVLGFLAVNLFFIPPYLTLAVAAPHNWAALLLYLGAALLVGTLAARVRERTTQAETARGQSALLADLNSALVGGATQDALLATIVHRVVTVFGAERARILLLGESAGAFNVAAAYPGAWPGLDEAAISQARMSLGLRAPAAPRPEPGDPFRAYVPVATGDSVLGVIEVERAAAAGRFTPAEASLLAAFASQAAIAVDRARLTDAAGRAAVLAGAADLKTALLAAVSHDLKTPLASIKASATALLDEGVHWNNDAKREFLQAIDEEADHLTLMVENLLDLSRIEGGALRPNREWYDAQELVDDVARRFAPRMAGRPFTVGIEPGLPLLWIDYVKIAQVLGNLLENALRHTPAGSPVAVDVRRTGSVVAFTVRDNGPGISPELQSRLFEPFFQAGSGTTGGSGVGLAICKGLVEAHGGRVWVTSAPGAGATFGFSLPIGPDDADGLA